MIDAERETAVHIVTIPDVPPAEWFNEPLDVEIKGAITVTDEGRIYGMIAPANTSHRGYQDRAVYVPMGNVDYSKFLKGETIVAGGGRVVTGVITADCGHSRTAAQMEQFDNTCSMVASVNVGEWPGRGVWMAGALLPGVTPSQISKLMAGAISGEWRAHPTRAGWYEFMAALNVPVPGFPMDRTEASIAADGATVSEEEPTHIIISSPVELAFRSNGCGCPDSSLSIPATNDPGLTAAAQFIAKSIGRDLQSRLTEIRASVHGQD